MSVATALFANWQNGETHIKLPLTRMSIATQFVAYHFPNLAMNPAILQVSNFGNLGVTKIVFNKKVLCILTMIKEGLLKLFFSDTAKIPRLYFGCQLQIAYSGDT